MEGDVVKLSELIDGYVSYSSNLIFMKCFRLVRNLGLKTSLDQYKVPREDLPAVAERALGGRNELHGDVVAFLEALYSSQ